jgi:hypothetical protein
MWVDVPITYIQELKSFRHNKKCSDNGVLMHTNEYIADTVLLPESLSDEVAG